MHNFVGKDLVSLKNIERADMELVFNVAREMEKILEKRIRIDLLKDKILGLMFFQVSTRTRISFESAMVRLGGGVVGFADPKVTRAGDYYAESLHDTVRVMEHYADIFAIRHPQDLAPAEAASFTDVPVINAGDGYNEHPTQALLDVYTILRERGSLENICVGMMGDMNIRAMHTLPLALARYQAKVYFISPPEVSMPEIWKKEFNRIGLNYQEIEDINDVLDELDVIYPVNIVSPDYHVSREEKTVDKKDIPDKYIVNREKVLRAKKDLLVLHSLPRKDELNPDVDPLPSARYFIQSYYGVAVRMALLALILGKAP